MNDKAAHARAWLAKADSDLTAARRLLEHPGPYDAVCFHAQQAAEKALKALLAFTNAPQPRTHNLEDLQALCLSTPAAEQLIDLRQLDLSELTPFAVESRYDIEFWPAQAEAAAAVSLAAEVCALASRVVLE